MWGTVMTRKSLGVAAGAIFIVGLAAQPASALPILDGGLTLDFATGLNIVGQTDASPCVIGGNSCDNNGFPQTVAEPPGGGGGTSAFSSPIYTVAQITGVIGGGPNF